MTIVIVAELTVTMRISNSNRYVWSENPIDATSGPSLSGIVQPGDLAAVRYPQGLLAVISEYRFSFGLGIVDVLPGVDFDMMAGGMFEDTESLGEFTSTSIESYWIGFGLTWRFGRVHAGQLQQMT